MIDHIMETLSMLKEIVRDLDVSEIPIKYIAAAYHVDKDGNEQVVYDEEMADLLARRYPFEQANDVNVLLDFRQVAIDVMLETNRIFLAIQGGLDG